MADEFARIARIAGVLGASPRDAAIELGIGDDAAVLRADGALVWTIDAQVEGVHFRRDLLADEDLGFRATIAAVSDVLAMGAAPLAALAAWTLPDGIDERVVDAIAEGQRAACAALGCPIVGGNLARGPAVSLTTTALGRVGARGALGRSSARPGDLLVVLGPLGEAALGLRALLAGEGAQADFAPFVAAWRRPPVHREAGARLATIARALVDVSDGLAQDVGHLATASGVRVVLDEAALQARFSAGFQSASAGLGLDATTLALAGGEDYALVAAVPADAIIDSDFNVIGRVEAGAGVVVRGRDGALRPAPAGYRHSS